MGLSGDNHRLGQAAIKRTCHGDLQWVLWCPHRVDSAVGQGRAWQGVVGPSCELRSHRAPRGTMQPRDSMGEHRRQTRLVGRNDETAKVPAKGEAGLATWQPCRQTRSACGTPGGAVCPLDEAGGGVEARDSRARPPREVVSGRQRMTRQEFHHDREAVPTLFLPRCPIGKLAPFAPCDGPHGAKVMEKKQTCRHLETGPVVGRGRGRAKSNSSAPQPRSSTAWRAFPKHAARGRSRILWALSPSGSSKSEAQILQNAAVAAECCRRSGLKHSPSSARTIAVPKGECGPRAIRD